MLEVQRFYCNGHIIHPEWNGKFEHIGYMNKLFRTKKEASDYYNQFNPNMRALNSNKNWRSDWNPDTKLRYLVREYSGEYLKIDPFE
jgi:hypothetical protein